MLERLKRVMFEHALLNGNVEVKVVMGPGVRLPPKARRDGITLEYEPHGLTTPEIMDVTDSGIDATVNVEHQEVRTFVPWQSIVQMEQRGSFKAVWPVDYSWYLPPKHQPPS